MLYFLAISLGGILGFMLCTWLRSIPTDAFLSHEDCDERFHRMHRGLSHEIQVREDEIQRLIRGEISY